MDQRTLSIFRNFNIKLWNGKEIRFSEQPKFVFEIMNKRCLWRMLWRPNELKLGRAYIEGEFEIKGDIFQAFEASESFRNLNLTWLEKAKLLKELWQLAKLRKGQDGLF